MDFHEYPKQTNQSDVTIFDNRNKWYNAKRQKKMKRNSNDDHHHHHFPCHRKE